MKPLLATLIMVLSLLSASVSVQADSVEANILLYHRFGEGRYPSTNIKIEQFEAHLDMLETGGYHVLPLSEITRRIKVRETLPDRTVAITIDDAYQSAAEIAWPLVKARGWTMTMFVATDPVDQKIKGYTDWDTLRRLQKEGMEIGHHSATHRHLADLTVAQAQADIERASVRFEEELGMVPQLLAYPFGEYSLPVRDMVKGLGFTAAFAQYSGTASPYSDIYSLPRFALNENYGGTGRFKLVAQAKALPVSDVLPSTPVLTKATNPPLFGFTVDSSVGRLGVLSCFPSHLGKAATLERLGARRIEVRFDKPMPKGRSRINCTMPAGDGRYYWFGAYFLRQYED